MYVSMSGACTDTVVDCDMLYTHTPIYIPDVLFCTYRRPRPGLLGGAGAEGRRPELAGLGGRWVNMRHKAVDYLSIRKTDINAPGDVYVFDLIITIAGLKRFKQAGASRGLMASYFSVAKAGGGGKKA